MQNEIETTFINIKIVTMYKKGLQQAYTKEGLPKQH